MAQTFEQVWDEVEESLTNAKAIAFDGCHKIYVLLDHAQVDEMLGYGYGYDEGTRLVHASSTDAGEMLKTLKAWYNESCALRFIDSIETDEKYPEKGFSSLIPQGYEDEFCVTCGDFGANIDGYCDSCQEDWAEEEEEEEEEE